MVLARWLENDYRRRETEYQHQILEHQNTIAELQHDIHRLNNIINPIPPPVAAEKEEDLEISLKMIVGKRKRKNNLCLWTMTRQMLCPVLTVTTPRHNLAIVLSWMR